VSELLQVHNLTVHFATEDGLVEAVDSVSFSVRPREILGVVGESGSGKSVTAHALLRLIRPPGRIVRGEIRFEGADLLALPEEQMGEVRGARIALVFQSPRTALNPVLTVGGQIARLYELQQHVSGPRRGDGPSRCSRSSGSQSLRGARVSTPTSSPAACASA